MSLQTPNVVEPIIAPVQPESQNHVLTEEKIVQNLNLADIDLKNQDDIFEPQNLIKPN